MISLKKLHHNAYRCIDSEATRKFYEDFLGLPLVKAFEINETYLEELIEPTIDGNKHEFF